MTYFADLSAYEYRSAEDAALNVGWLDDAHGFETAAPTEAFLDALWCLVLRPVHMTRGVHSCVLCPPDPTFAERHAEYLRRTRAGDYGPFPENSRYRANHARRGNETALIGTAEIRVVGHDNKVYAAPTLIYHYVAEHSYKPPEEFVQAVVRQWIP